MWLHVPSTCFLYVPGSLGATLDSDWRYDLLAQYVTSNGKHMPVRSWKRVCKIKPSMKLLYGQILPPSMADLGVKKWISSLPVILVSPSPSRASAKVVPIRDISGHTSRELYPRYLRGNVSSRMSRTIFDLASEMSPVTYDVWVTKLRLDYLARRKQGRPTSGLDSLSWPTPRACHAGEHPPDSGKTGGRSLDNEASRWPTPSVPNGGQKLSPEDVYAKGKTAKGKRQVHLENLAELWPTPTSSATTGVGGLREGSPNIQTAASWFTPTGRDYRDHGCSVTQEKCLLGRQVLTTPVAGQSISESSPARLPRSQKRKLNPYFVEALLGLPTGHTDYAPLETGSFLWWLLTHTAILAELCKTLDGEVTLDGS